MQNEGGRVRRVFGIGLEIGLGVFLVTLAFLAWRAPSTQATSAKSASAKEYKKAMRSAAALPQAATLCLQDDSSGSFLTFDRTTGAYTYNDCPTGFTIGGTGQIKTMGMVISLKHVAPDRRLVATDDLALQRGNASLQLFSPARQFTIYDRKTANDTCACASQTSTARRP